MKRQMMASLCAALVASCATANNLKIANVEIKGRDNRTALIRFDISWENSWRYAADDDELYFHDAAWVFFKIKPETVNGVADNNYPWQHARLEETGVNPTDFSAGAGTPVELVVPEDGVGMFVRRSQDGDGTTAVQKVTAVWNFATNGLVKTDNVMVRAFGVEMCYVAEGTFKVGDGRKDAGQLYEGGSGANPQPFAITGDGAINCADEAGSLWGVSTNGNTTMGGEGEIPAAFPNGYKAFYGMKYFITQGQYTDFLNTLTRQQQVARGITTVNNYMGNTSAGSATVVGRNTVQLINDPGDPLPRVYATETRDRACNVSCADWLALLAWSGLRPMTELEYEKACRGPLEPVNNEYAWGTVNATHQTGHTGVDGSGEEGALPSNANICNLGTFSGPVRVGIYATPGASREKAGASYWGMMEMSGVFYQRYVSIGDATGRGFAGKHGDGTLTSNGDASVSLWPSASAGSGFRSSEAVGSARTSNRAYGLHTTNPNRATNYGGRGGRTAP